MKLPQLGNRYIGRHGVVKVSLHALMLLTLGLVAISGIIWISRHPFPFNYDEAYYLNRVTKDQIALAGGSTGDVKQLSFSFERFDGSRDDIVTIPNQGFIAWMLSIIGGDRMRPPAYRLLSMPILIAFNATPGTLRLFSYIILFSCYFLIYKVLSKIVSTSSAAFGVMFLGLSPSLIFSGLVFGTEFPTYLATALLLFFIFRDWDHEEMSGRSWIGLGVSIGLGLLARSSFILVAGPLVILSLLVNKIWGKTQGMWRTYLKGTCLGVVIASPWWIVNLNQAYSYARYAAGRSRHSLGPISVETWLKLIKQYIDVELGIPLFLLLILLLGLVLVSRRRNPVEAPKALNLANFVCLISAVIPFGYQLFSTNHNPRYLAQGLFPFGIGVAIMAEIGKLEKHFKYLAVASTLILVQLAITVIPTVITIKYPKEKATIGRPPHLVFALAEQWDWNMLKDITDERGLKDPLIAYLGNANSMNPPQIAYPWVRAGDDVQIVWLWRYEDGEIDWPSINENVNTVDIVLTALEYDGEYGDKQHLDNQYDDEFYEQMMGNNAFEDPIHLAMGLYESVDLAVFIHN